MKHEWLSTIVDDAAMAALCDALSPGAVVAAEGAWGSSAHLTAGAVHWRTRRPVLLIVAHLDDADEAVDDLALFDGLAAAALPALEVLPGESNASLELLADRVAMTARLAAGDQPGVLVAPVQALMQGVPKRETLGAAVMELAPGQTLDPAALMKWLGDAGYRRVEAVEEVGDFAMRGGIIDICPAGGAPPVRLDFFGDQLDEIAEIDLDSMGSDRKLPGVRLITADAAALQHDETTTAAWSMLRDDTVIVVAEAMEVAEQARGYYERLTDPTGIFAPQSVNKALRRFALVEVNQFAPSGMSERKVTLGVRSLANFEQDAAKAMRELGELATGSAAHGVEAHRVVVLCQREAEAARLRELLGEHAPEARDRVGIEMGYLYRGFVWGERAKPPFGSELRAELQAATAALAVVPHHELFHRYRARRRIRKVATQREGAGFFDIEVDDYVVHAQHGIARFRGMRLMKRDADESGEGEEYPTLEFADKALLHVPASEIGQVHKYVGGFAGRPPLSKLGGARWKKAKADAEEAARQLAQELLQVQAARASMPGISYGDDTVWMRQFEAEFPYTETDDQLAAIAEMKKDMRASRPMDRLICGDVGYGKTEVAMRAAFKAVEAGRQVAVLCPTTVLCEQHERTFRERMADYPVQIAALNRLKNAAQTRAVLEGVEKGGIDVVIGTHRVLSDDVKFADLGVVIVDEEQRFGVEHKNRLMRFRVTVDVLTLSATPIPRTLHMALLGLRDISSLSTPPADRRAVVTEVVPYEPKRIRAAMLRELNRDGQGFYVHNRVHSIHEVAMELQQLVPEARFGVGHGQMAGRELESVMMQFLNHEIDFLICTTIIESGIDIPTANTMFIADCDRFGLAELHQLRGRVGRYKHRAYCYMLLPKTRALTEVALRRLHAIESYSMLGAGFKIAMRDMEIRGVGNLLGPEQSGHIAAVGYELYCELLEQQTRELRREPTITPIDTHLELGVSGHLPKRYIASDTRRMSAYRRIVRAPSFGALREIERDLTAAYGELPRAAQALLALAELRVALTHLRVASLKRKDRDLIFTTRHVKELSEVLRPAKGSVRIVDTPTMKRAGTVYYRPPAGYLDEAGTMLAVLRQLLVAPLESVAKTGEAGRAGVA